MEPSIRGSLFVTGVVAIRRHRESGVVAPEQVAARLGPVALELLDQKIDVGRWYPIAPFCEMIDMDWDVAGGREPDYMRVMGRNTASRFFETGIYQQLDYARRSQRSSSRSVLLRRAKLVMTVAEALYSFIETEVQVERERLTIVYGNARPFSEALRYTTEGFMNEVNCRQGASRTWTSERVAPDRVCFHLELPGWLAGGD